ncbi:hypothetical protein [Burkholderia multivorans]|uniref:hypothetical protein n=1 Tax=Burkholderia multivorans TaxID=87883 RepID=UPI001C228424|nr:hypothetical protein [Burkholderia multivorans]EKS9914889.1 hypothetical protein [Burkholderia multivorans]MBU9310891.1 hypothetical protein [Burkholderia multivorans]
MAQRKPAVSTLLKNAQARIAELEKKAENDAKSMKYHEKRADEAQAELQQLHAFFDALPGTIPEQDKETYKRNNAMTRLAAWLATSRA